MEITYGKGNTPAESIFQRAAPNVADRQVR